MQGDEGRWPADEIDGAEPGWDDDGDRRDYWDGRVTNEDFVDPPRPDASRDPARPLYDGRPIRDPYDRGGGYRRVSDAVWARAREDYLQGDAAETVCARHGLALSTLRQRARTEGWRRLDQPDPLPADLDIDMAAEIEAGLPDYADIARHALVRLNRAVRAGRAAEAAGWARIHRQMLEMARAAEATHAPPAPAPASAPKPAPKPEKTLDPQATAMAKARAVQTLVRAVADLDPSNPTGRRLIDKSLEVLDALDRTPISDDSHHSDGVFPPTDAPP